LEPKHIDVTHGGQALESRTQGGLSHAELFSQIEKNGVASVASACRPVTDILSRVGDKWSVMIVGYLKRSTVNRLAQQNDDLDIIINSDGTGITLDAMQVNNTLIVYAAKETKHLGELRFYTDADGVVERFTNRYVELDEIIPDEPQLAAITKQARQEIDVVQTKMAEAEAELIAAQRAVLARLMVTPPAS